MAVIHKADAVKVTKCGALILNDSRDSWSLFWDAVNCPECLALRPKDAPERTSLKRSHRAEGVNYVD